VMRAKALGSVHVGAPSEGTAATAS
jgi:hypothetical protein